MAYCKICELILQMHAWVTGSLKLEGSEDKREGEKFFIILKKHINVFFLFFMNTRLLGFLKH
jgi:hypothetical protein